MKKTDSKKERKKVLQRLVSQQGQLEAICLCMKGLSGKCITGARGARASEKVSLL